MLLAGQKLPSAALAADKTSVVSAEKTSVVSRAKTSVAAAENTPDISTKSTTPRGCLRRPRGVVDEIEMSGVFSAAATDVLAFDATDVFSADTTDVFSAAKAASGGSCPAIGHCSIVGQRSIVRPTFNSTANVQ